MLATCLVTLLSSDAIEQWLISLSLGAIKRWLLKQVNVWSSPCYSLLYWFGLHSQCKQHKGKSLKVFTRAAFDNDQCDQHGAPVSHAAAAATLLHHTSHAWQMKRNMRITVWLPPSQKETTQCNEISYCWSQYLLLHWTAASPCNEAHTYAEKSLHSRQAAASLQWSRRWNLTIGCFADAWKDIVWRHNLLYASQKGHRGNWKIDRDAYQLLISPAFVYGSVFTNSSISWNMKPAY